MAVLEAKRPVTKPLGPFPKRSHKTAVKVYKLICQHFDEEELSLLAFDVGVDMEEVGSGRSKLSRCKALVEYVWRRGDLQGLILLAQGERPNVEWPVVPAR